MTAPSRNLFVASVDYECRWMDDDQSSAAILDRWLLLDDELLESSTSFSGSMELTARLRLREHL
jgi:hypothetical protein